jgi:ABC-type oligopeptide transport system ATPase subunit
MSATPLLAVEKLRKHYFSPKPWIGKARPPIQAVDDVSFTIERGETLALVGESGSGKSTVARMVVGLLTPSAGTVEIDGVSMHEPASVGALRALRHRIQMIFQDPYASLNPRWRVDRIIAEPIRAFGVAENDAACMSRVGELLKLVGLDPADGVKYPHEFSGGQRQRIAIARCLTLDPEVLVLDEAVSALDVSVQAQILNLLLDLTEHLGLNEIRGTLAGFVVPHCKTCRQLRRKVYAGALHAQGSTNPLLHKRFKIGSGIPGQYMPQQAHSDVRVLKLLAGCLSQLISREEIVHPRHGVGGKTLRVLEDALGLHLDTPIFAILDDAGDLQTAVLKAFLLQSGAGDGREDHHIGIGRVG